MPVFTESKHAGEGLLSEANGNRSRETATVLSGENLLAGTPVILSTGKLAAADGVTACVGVLWDAVDASAGDVTDAVYIARDAEYRDASLTYPAESTAGGEKAQVVASLLTLGIVTR